MSAEPKAVAGLVAAGQGDLNTTQHETAAASSTTPQSLFARETLVRGEDPQQFREFSRAIHLDLQPHRERERFCVDQIINFAWRLARVIKVESNILEWGAGRQHSTTIGFAEDANNFACLPRLARLEGQLGRQLDKTLVNLRKLQARRLGRTKPSPNTASGATRPPIDRGLTTHAPPQGNLPERGQSEVQAPSPAQADGRPREPAGYAHLLQHVAVRAENPEEFHQHCERVFDDWRPRGAVEGLYVAWLAVTSWRLARLARIEAGLYTQNRRWGDTDGGVAIAFGSDVARANCFAKLARCESQLHNRFCQILKVLSRETGIGRTRKNA